MSREATDKIAKYISEHNISYELNYNELKRVASEISIIANIKVDDLFLGAMVGRRIYQII